MTSDDASSSSLVPDFDLGKYGVGGDNPPAEHDHDSVRRFEHAGHQIEIRTRYTILIDGVEFPDSIHVANDGTVHYHGFPQYSAPSAVDIVKLIAERMVEGEPPPLIGENGPPDGPGDHHDHHGGGH